MRMRLRALIACTVVAAIGTMLPLPIVGSSAFAAGDTTISGVVTDAVGTPLTGIEVFASGSISSGQTTTIADGSYTIHDLSTDTYHVLFQDLSGVNSPEWWSGQPDPSTANPVSVTLGDAITGIDAALSLTTISGVVTGELGQPLAGVQVQAYGLRYNAQATTGPDGSYTLTGLGGDTYRISFRDPGYSPEWYGKQPDYLTAVPVSVSLGDAITGIDAALSLTTISGVVTDELGQPLAGVRVDAFGLNNDPETTTGPDGSYTFTGVPPDTYRISFVGSGYSPEWWNNQPDFPTGEPVTVGFGDAITGIDAALSVTTISGVVSDASGQPLAGVQVLAYGTSYTVQATTGPDGSYTLTGLGVDTYRISFFDPDSGVLPSGGTASPTTRRQTRLRSASTTR
jgi:hypothetical protein